MREVDSLKTLRHPCVIPFVGWSIRDSEEYEIQMEWAEGGNLKEWIAGRRSGRPLEVSTQTLKARMICELVLGMRYVHSYDIMHRDLKPSNILLDEEYHAMIGDFGLSRSGVGDGPPTKDARTELYAAPEQLVTGGSYTKEVDIFSFGLIVSELVEGPTDFAKFRSTTPPVLSKIFGPLLQRLIPRCCSLAASSRPSFAAIFAKFEKSGFAILPDADPKAIESRVSKVLKSEKDLRRWK
jgi:serine/threonine protein kinase